MPARTAIFSLVFANFFVRILSQNTTCSHGTTIVNLNSTICECDEGYSGDFCDVPRCENGVNHGNHECHCHTGWEGEFCSIPICVKGRLDLQNRCRCENGYEGHRCHIAICKHGIPDTQSPICHCANQWEGEFCELIRCANGGRRVGNGVACLCAPHYFGLHCDFRCIRGTIKNNQLCECELGWKGVNCSVGEIKKNNMFWLWIGVSIAIFGILLLIIIAVFWFVKKTAKLRIDRDAERRVEGGVEPPMELTEIPRLPTYQEAMQEQTAEIEETPPPYDEVVSESVTVDDEQESDVDR